MQRQQMAQRVHRRMHLRSLPPLGPVVSAARARFRRRLQHATIQDHRRRLREIVERPGVYSSNAMPTKRRSASEPTNRQAMPRSAPRPSKYPINSERKS